MDGFAYAGGLVKIGAGRLGLTHTYDGFDFGSTESAHEVVSLRAAEYFLGCEAMSDAYERYVCLKDWSVGPPLATCEQPCDGGEAGGC